MILHICFPNAFTITVLTKFSEISSDKKLISSETSVSTETKYLLNYLFKSSLNSLLAKSHRK